MDRQPEQMAGEKRLPLVEVARLVGTTIGRQTEPRSSHVRINGIRIHYLEWGRASDPVLLLVHSGEESAHSWDLVALALSDTHRIIALDCRGCGESEWAPDGVYERDDAQRD